MKILVRLNGNLMFWRDITLRMSQGYVCIFDGVMPGRSASPNTKHSRSEDGGGYFASEPAHKCAVVHTVLGGKLGS